MNSKLKIAYVSSSDPRNQNSWSGSHYAIYSALTKHIGSVDVLGPYSPSFPIFIGKCISFLAQKLLGKRYNYRHSRFVSKSFGRFFSKKLKHTSYDLIVAPAGSSEIAYLITHVPILYISDATTKSSLNYHKALSRLFVFSQKESIDTERRALEKSTLIALTSQWAAKSAIDDFKINKEKVFVLPFGANLKNPPTRQQALQKTKGTVCRLLFVGVQWENKGGAIAFNTLLLLLKSGIDATLTICGCVPPENIKHEKLTVIPFLNKSIPSEERKLYALFKEANFLILPTRFEAYGLVFCEASAYGTPSLATDTGGVSSVISNGENGFLFSLADKGEGYAEKIKELWNDDTAYEKLCESSRSIYEERLNWDAWASTLKKKLLKIN